ncbi:protein maelstrom homolog [Ciona intestinalis]
MFAISGQTITNNKPARKKKKAPKNAFSFFLDEEYENRKKNGLQIPKNEVANLIGDKWKNMSKEEKSVYEMRAKQLKMNKGDSPSDVIMRSDRLDCTNQPISNRVDMHSFIESQRSKHREYLMQRWNEVDVLKEHFFIISFQSLYELPDEEGYLPCEVTCVDYTLHGGIEGIWHNIIDPGAFKAVLMSEVKFFREGTHQIARDCEYARSNYYELWKELVGFIRQRSQCGRTLPPIYCRMSELRKNQFCLNWLSQSAQMANQLSKLHELEHLARELICNAVNTKFALTSIEDGFKSSMWEYEPGIKCKFHEDVDCYFCTMLTIKKCCFWMSEVLAPYYGFELTRNHLPEESNEPLVSGNFKFDMNPKVSRPHTYEAPDVSNSAMSSTNNSTFASRDIRYNGSYKLRQSNHVHQTNFYNDYHPDLSLCDETASLVVTDDNFPSLGSETEAKQSVDKQKNSQSWKKQFSNTKTYNTSGFGKDDPLQVDEDNFPALGNPPAFSRRPHLNNRN